MGARQFVWFCGVAVALSGLAGLSLAVPEEGVLAPSSPIVMWSDLPARLPDGWQVCDGTNGTPDLRDRFILGVQGAEQIGRTGGAHSITLGLEHLPGHNHPFDTSSAGNHFHEWVDRVRDLDYTTERPGGVIVGDGIDHLSSDHVDRTTDVVGPHKHSGTTSAAGSAAPFDNRPPYFRLAFVTVRRDPRAAFFATPGTIVVWGGDAGDLPPGWRICDGTNGTPDLRDRFVLGARAGESPGETGGSEKLALSSSQLPGHDHPFLTDAGGNHAHGYSDYWSADLFFLEYGGWLPYGHVLVEDSDFERETSSTGGEHSHYGTTHLGGQGVLIDSRPAYTRMPFIMLTSTVGGQAPAIPTGSIAIWSGLVSDLPDGWRLCDGADGTPDLRGRFVVGGEASGESGGADQIQLTMETMAAHSHGFGTKAAGAHSHVIEDHWRKSSYVWMFWPLPPPFLGHPAGNRDTARSTSRTGNHSHSGVTGIEGSAEPLPYDNRPAYYEAAFIMRVPEPGVAFLHLAALGCLAGLAQRRGGHRA